MSIRTRLFASIAAAAFALALTSSAALAAKGDCSQPVSNGAGPVATDCLFILQAAVGAQICSPVCVCDLNGSSGNPNATDALACLNASVGVPGLLNCPPPCGDSPVVPKNACSVGEFIAAAGSDLDAGWTGSGHNASVVEGASVFIQVVRRCGGTGTVCEYDSECTAPATCDLTCDCDSDDNTVCEITGPAGDKHCVAALNKTCASNTDCASGDGTCEKFFGPPLPLSAEGIPTCVTTYFQEDLSGTADSKTGAGVASAFLRSRVHLGIVSSKPCPRCGALEQNPAVGDAFTCDGGPRNGSACTVDAVSPDFGGTSFDCPPDTSTNVSGIGLAIRFSEISTGTRALQAVVPCGGGLDVLHPSSGAAHCMDDTDFTGPVCASNDDCLRCTGDLSIACTSNGDCTGNGNCAAAPDQPIACGVYCHCGFCDGVIDAPCTSDDDCDAGQTCRQGSGSTQQSQPNKCNDLICGLGGPEACCSGGEPACSQITPEFGKCSLKQYVTCNNNADCSAQTAGTCNLTNRPCFEGKIERTGVASPLGSYCIDDPDVGTCTTNADCNDGACVSDASEPTTVAMFCIPPTTSASVNTAGGIPGPGALTFKSVVLSYRCGDGTTSGIEECDDGNNANGDGCDEICRTE